MRKELLVLLAHEVRTEPGLAPVRDAKERAKLPPDERAEWEQFWAAAAPDIAPPPREVKR